MTVTRNTDRLVDGVPYDVHCHLRYARIGLDEFSTRRDVIRLRHLLPRVPNVGRVRLAIIDRWLAGEDCR